MAENKTKIMIRIAMLTAASTILFLFDVPLPFVAPPFYELDLSNVASLIGGFAMGPMAGVSIEFLKNLINLMIDGSITGGVGELSNFLTSCAFVVPASVIYKMSKTKKSAFFRSCDRCSYNDCVWTFQQFICNDTNIFQGT